MTSRLANSARCLSLAALAGSLLVSACGGGGDNGTGPQPTQPNPEAVSRIDVSAPTTTLTPGQTVQLTATARNANGGTIGGVAPTWTTSAATVATVSSTGLVTALTAGTVTITSAADGKSGTIALTVASGAGVLSTVGVTLLDGTIEIGNYTQATVRGTDATGATLPLGTRAVTWTSSNPSVATVDASGYVNAIGVGTVDIRVSVADGTTPRTSSARLTVTGIAGAPINASVGMLPERFSPFQTTVKQGGTVSFVFGSIIHNVIWNRTRTGAPTDINNNANVTIARTFPTVGVFDFTCTLHAGMDGQIIVTP